MALLGQVALVLGGSSGIGLATVEELLRAGMSVVVGDVAKEKGEDAVNKLQAQFGLQRTVFVHVDVRSKEQVEDAFVSTMQYFKKIDVFINSAGILNDMQWELEVDINFNGIIRGTLAAWNHMGKHEGGRGGTVINIASQLGLEAFAGSPIYCATKHGVIGFSRSCGAGECGSRRAPCPAARGKRQRVGERGRRGHLRSRHSQAPRLARAPMIPPPLSTHTPLSRLLCFDSSTTNRPVVVAMKC